MAIKKDQDSGDSRNSAAPDSAVREDSVLGKTHLLLSSFSLSNSTLGLTELSRISGVPKASTYRLAQQLVDLGYFVKTPRGYQLGWRIYEMGQIVPGPARLRAVARPSLVDLRMALKALLVHLAVLHGDDVVYLERIGGRREVALLAAVGATVPADRTVSGQVLQAYRVQGHTHLGEGSLSEEHQRIRERRWASEAASVVPGTKTFSVPIEYPGGTHVIAALSATVHIDRQDDQVILRTLWAAAVEIGRAVQRGLVR